MFIIKSILQNFCKYEVHCNTVYRTYMNYNVFVINTSALNTYPYYPK